MISPFLGLRPVRWDMKQLRRQKSFLRTDPAFPFRLEVSLRRNSKLQISWPHSSNRAKAGHIILWSFSFWSAQKAPSERAPSKFTWALLDCSSFKGQHDYGQHDQQRRKSERKMALWDGLWRGCRETSERCILWPVLQYRGPSHSQRPRQRPQTSQNLCCPYSCCPWHLSPAWTSWSP